MPVLKEFWVYRPYNQFCRCSLCELQGVHKWIDEVGEPRYTLFGIRIPGRLAGWLGNTFPFLR